MNQVGGMQILHYVSFEFYMVVVFKIFICVNQTYLQSAHLVWEQMNWRAKAINHRALLDAQSIRGGFWTRINVKTNIETLIQPMHKVFFSKMRRQSSLTIYYILFCSRNLSGPCLQLQHYSGKEHKKKILVTFFPLFGENHQAVYISSRVLRAPGSTFMIMYVLAGTEKLNIEKDSRYLLERQKRTVLLTKSHLAVNPKN